MTKVLVAHPTRQHAHRFAAALQESGDFHSFWTLLPDRQNLSWLPRCLDALIPMSVFRHSLQNLPRDRVRVLLGPLYMQKLTASSASSQVRDFGEWMAWLLFDRWVASWLPRIRPDVVIGYEMCCSETFVVAKKLGIRCVLDAAACHYDWVDSLMPPNITGKNSWAGKQLRQRKSREIDLANTIVCTSELAFNTYRDAGVGADRLFINPPGCDRALFSPSEGGARKNLPRFIFVGQPAYHKGFDVLVEAFLRLIDEYPEVELIVAGPSELSMMKQEMPGVRFLGKLSQQDVRFHLGQSDCLLLPSRCDSFGMVVVEALSSGVPAILSENTGSAMVIKDGVNGWIVRAGMVEDLFARMKYCCDNLSRLRAMRKNCPGTVADYDWNAYSFRARNIINQTLKNVSESQCLKL